MVQRYRKKPVIIEAIQFMGNDNIIECQQFIWGDDIPVEERGKRHIAIKTLEGTMIAEPSDYIIKGTAGEFYPCKEAIFNDLYDLVRSFEEIDNA